MAANGGNNDRGDGRVWSEFDASMGLDDFDDVMDFIEVPGGDLFDWAEVPSNGADPSVDGSAPPVAGTAAITAPSSSAHQGVAGSSASAHQGGLDCTGCQILREIVHSNGRHFYCYTLLVNPHLMHMHSIL